jgi:hypothetical protein
VGIEGHDTGLATSFASLLPNALEQGAVASVQAIELSDGDDRWPACPDGSHRIHVIC